MITLGHIKNIYRNNETIFKNFVNLWILQFVRLATPLLLIPILVNTIGIEKYGLIVFAQTLVLYFIILLNFGFEMSATKQISINRNNHEKLSEIITSTLVIKFIIMLFSIIVYTVMLIFIPILHSNFYLFLFSFLFIAQSILVPIWFFQGIEKMKFLTIVDAISRLIYLLLVIFFVSNPNDYLLVPIFRFFGIIIAGIFSIYFVFFKEKVTLKFLDFNKIKFYFYEGLPFFYSYLSSVINARTNTLLLGIFTGMTTVAYYDFVSKVVEALNSIFGTFIKVLYPHISATKNRNKAKKAFQFILSISLLSYIILCLLSKGISTLFFGVTSFPIYTLFYLIGILLPLVAIEWSLGDLYLAPFNYSKDYSLSSIYSTLFYMIILIVLFIFDSIALYSLIIALIARFIFISIYRYYCCRKYNLI